MVYETELKNLNECNAMQTEEVCKILSYGKIMTNVQRSIFIFFLFYSQSHLTCSVLQYQVILYWSDMVYDIEETVSIEDNNIMAN